MGVCTALRYSNIPWIKRGAISCFITHQLTPARYFTASKGLESGHKQGCADSYLHGYEAIKVSVLPNDPVAILQLNRPSRMNALTEKMAEEIMDFIFRINNAEDVNRTKCLVITGCEASNGKYAFSTGRDLKISAQHTTQEQKDYYMNVALQSVLAIKDCVIPTIASIRGATFGWGAELSLACDIRYLSPCSTICFPETAIGIFPGAAGAVFLPRVLPSCSAAREMIFTSSRYTGQEAAELGFGRLIQEDKDVNSHAIDVAVKIASNAPLGLRQAKVVMNKSLTGNLEDALAVSKELRAPLSNTEDFKEGLQSFKEKRKPQFKGK